MVSFVVIRDTENEPGVSDLVAHALCNTITKASHVPCDYQTFCMSVQWNNNLCLGYCAGSSWPIHEGRHLGE